MPVPICPVALCSNKALRHITMNEPALPPELHKEELAMTRFTGVLSAVFLLELAVPASAHFGFLFRQRPAAAYYYPVPVAEFCVQPLVICVPVIVETTPARPFAQPQPAPASTGKEPPLAEPDKSVKPAPMRPQVSSRGIKNERD